MLQPLRLLAIDTSTHTMSVGLALPPCQAGGAAAMLISEAPGSANTSSALLPAIQSLLQQAHLTLAQLDGLVVGNGPGSFTGLRTACAVAQGLAYGTRCSRHVNGLPVLPLSTLAAVAENARLNWCQQHPHAHEPLRVAAMLDARMGEVYVGHYTFANPQQASAQAQGEPWLTKPEHIGQTLAAHAHCNLWAGNVFDVHAQHMAAPPCPSFATHPNAAALLRLALECWQPEHTVWAEGVQPLYVRNKVAQTTAERLQVRATTV